MIRSRFVVLAVTAIVLLTAGAAVGPGLSLGPVGAGAGASPRPVIFVHGFAGSGAQFESQAMRFASNGYPVDAIRVHDYDSSFTTETQADMMARLDDLIAELQADTGADQVDLLGHSLGTAMMQIYLNSDPERAADVAHYVNLDGATASAPPGGVDTLAIWGAGDPDREITGAINVHFPDQTHTQTVTSSETFAEVYEFFTGEAPATVDIVREPADDVTIAGRVLHFLTNDAPPSGSLEIYEVDGSTGHRVDATPEATYPIAGDGSWGPFAADGNAHYEFAIVRGDNAHHWYFQSFPRTDHVVRLLTTEPDMGLDALWDKADDHSNMSIVRYKEWWGDQPGANDSLQIDGTETINAATAPQSKRAIALFAYDLGSDGASNVSAPIPAFFGLPFLTAVDLDMPATTPPDGTISIVETPRLGAGSETINVPNWASSTDPISVQFNDFHVTQAPAGGGGGTTTTTTSPTTPPSTPPPAQPVPASPSFTG